MSHAYKRHTNLRAKILLEANKYSSVRLWPNAVGLGINGEVVNEFTKGGDRYITIKNPRYTKYGLCTGSLDCIGFKTEIIEGHTVPRFIALDAKLSGDYMKPDQKRYRDMVIKSGGYSGEIRKIEDISKILHL